MINNSDEFIPILLINNKYSLNEENVFSLNNNNKIQIDLPNNVIFFLFYCLPFYVFHYYSRGFFCNNYCSSIVYFKTQPKKYCSFSTDVRTSGTFNILDFSGLYGRSECRFISV